MSMPNLSKTNDKGRVIGLNPEVDNNVVIIYSRDMYGRMLANIVRYYCLHKGIPNVTVGISPSKTHSIRGLFQKDILQCCDTVFFLNMCPKPQDFEKVLTNYQKVIWFDSRYTKVPDEFETWDRFDVSTGELLIDGYRTDTCDLGVELWTYLEALCPEMGTKVPACVKAIDHVMSENATIGERAFFEGLTLCETRPRFAYEFWAALFNTLDALPDDASDEERAKRMQWDAYMQVCNMGNIIVEHIAHKTRLLLRYIKPMTLPGCGGAQAALVNTRDADIDMLKAYCKRKYPRCPYCGIYYQENKLYPEFHVELLANSEEADCRAIAEKMDGYAPSNDACIFCTPSLVYDYVEYPTDALL